MKWYIVLFVTLMASCSQRTPHPPVVSLDSSIVNSIDTLETSGKHPELTPIKYAGQSTINTGTTTPADLVAFAKTLIGIPYLYASSDPSAGFDCSGFITYVFNHFNIAVPRSSVDFTNVQHEVALPKARPGDLILFTGTDSTVRVVGHMGIITENTAGKIHFIHATSGKQYGVTITPLERYYMGRFVKVIRVFSNK